MKDLIIHISEFLSLRLEKTYVKLYYKDKSVTTLPNLRSEGKTPEEAFWKYHLTLQDWYQHFYDMKVVQNDKYMYILNKLVELGDPLAKDVYQGELKKETLRSGNLRPILFDCLTKEEFRTFFPDVSHLITSIFPLYLSGTLIIFPGIIIGVSSRYKHRLRTLVQK